MSYVHTLKDIPTMIDYGRKKNGFDLTPANPNKMRRGFVQSFPNRYYDKLNEVVNRKKQKKKLERSELQRESVR